MTDINTTYHIKCCRESSSKMNPTYDTGYEFGYQSTTIDPVHRIANVVEKKVCTAVFANVVTHQCYPNNFQTFLTELLLASNLYDFSP